MNDCPNAEIRDQLPDLLHDRLTVSVRAVVIAHVDECIDCREELALLRSLHATFVARPPRVDITYVVNALPKPAAARPVVAARPRRTWVDWRIAAAVTFLAVGGASVAVMNRDRSPVATQIVADSPTARVPETTTVATTEDAAGLQMGGRLADLNDQELQALIGDIEQMKAVPETDPAPVTIKVDSRISLPDDGGY